MTQLRQPNKSRSTLISCCCCIGLILVISPAAYQTGASSSNTNNNNPASFDEQDDIYAIQASSLNQRQRSLDWIRRTRSMEKPEESTTTDGGSSNGEMIVHEREFLSPQVRVQMECQRDKTLVKVNFTKPFSGILGAGRLDVTKCKLYGNGTKYYELQVHHNATQCDTQWDSVNSSIFNTLFIRFHQSLETGSDVAKNIMCRLKVGDLVVGRRPLKKSQKPQQNDQMKPSPPS